ncbi:hypothetical protein F444_17017, partial [Phytophthora nicotianae P1976]
RHAVWLHVSDIVRREFKKKNKKTGEKILTRKLLKEEEASRKRTKKRSEFLQQRAKQVYHCQRSR